jgi:hypothetical protein
MSASISLLGQPLAMRSRVWVSQACGSTLFIFAVYAGVRRDGATDVGSTGNQAIIRIERRAASLGERTFITRLLPLELENALLFPLGFHVGPLCNKRCLNCNRLNDPHQLTRNRSLAAKIHASW